MVEIVNIAVLVSGRGSNLQFIIDSIDRGEINGKIEMVISNKRDAYGLKRAENHGIQGLYIGKGNYPDIHDRSIRILEALRESKIDLIILAGYMSILDKKIIDEFKNRIINIHPSLIPSFCGKGYYGEKVHEAVIQYGVKLTGATVHFVDEGADTGPVILQKAVNVDFKDTPETIADKVLKVEHELLPKAVKMYCEGRIMVEGRRVKIKSEIGDRR